MSLYFDPLGLLHGLTSTHGHNPLTRCLSIFSPWLFSSAFRLTFENSRALFQRCSMGDMMRHGPLGSDIGFAAICVHVIDRRLGPYSPGAQSVTLPDELGNVALRIVQVRIQGSRLQCSRSRRCFSIDAVEVPFPNRRRSSCRNCIYGVRLDGIKLLALSNLVCIVGKYPGLVLR